MIDLPAIRARLKNVQNYGQIAQILNDTLSLLDEIERLKKELAEVRDAWRNIHP